MYTKQGKKKREAKDKGSRTDSRGISTKEVLEVEKRFVPRKGKVYSLSRDEREEVQAFVEDQLRKSYI